MTGFATDEQVLLRAILANPADDAPRLALADVLEESGQAERADFIRQQLQVPAMGNAFCGLAEDHSLAHFKWAYDLYGIFEAGTEVHKAIIFRRGFVDEIRLTLAQFLAHARGIAQRHPVTKWVATDKQPRFFSESMSYGWRRFDKTSGATEEACDLAPEIYDILAYPSYGAIWQYYRSQKKAITALQQALYAYARS